jgi:D-tagatose-1,6-bisphosphate aldolase subunit GatZ/KbaZ
VYRYNLEKCKPLKEFIKHTPFVFEAHSTDYQTCEDLKQMVKDGFAILKVGPELTYLFREAIFSLALLEKEIIEEDRQSRIVEILVEEMRRDPIYWKNYYKEGDFLDIKYSFLDRIRYYWNRQPVKIALKKLLANLENKKLTIPLVSQYFPELFPNILQGKITLDPLTLIFEKIGKAFEKYSKATFQI